MIVSFNDMTKCYPKCPQATILIYIKKSLIQIGSRKLGIIPQDFDHGIIVQTGFSHISPLQIIFKQRTVFREPEMLG
ncbi:hypothetical protein AYY16_06930 [Morganella psychrotolerans]|nr:hypothetical protein AYY16_06930 [Morganella psychrotolerans]